MSFRVVSRMCVCVYKWVKEGADEKVLIITSISVGFGLVSREQGKIKLEETSRDRLEGEETELRVVENQKKRNG